MIDHGYDVESIDTKDWRNPTWLNEACFFGLYDIARILLQMGANPRVKSYDNIDAYKIVHTTMYQTGDRMLNLIDTCHLARRAFLLALV